MKFLAVDTSSVACSVAVEVDGRIEMRHQEQARAHTKILVPMVEDCLRASGVSLSDLDAIVLGNGPGSFIGMRIAASFVQGLAFSAGLRVIPVSSLLAVAEAVFDNQDVREVLVAQDAHREQAYFGRYGRDAAGRTVPLIEECLVDMADLPVSFDAGQRAAGAAWPSALPADFYAGIETPRAEYLLPTAHHGGEIDPADIHPAYLREQVAAVPRA